MIEVNNVSKGFDGKPVLKDISVKFEQGKTNLIIGASGTGKSVLLKSIVGLVQPDEGNVLFDGRDFTHAGKSLEFKSMRKQELKQKQHMMPTPNVSNKIK